MSLRIRQRLGRRDNVLSHATTAVIYALESRLLFTDDITHVTESGSFYGCSGWNVSSPPLVYEPFINDIRPNMPTCPCNCHCDQPQVSKKPIRYGDGTPVLNVDDLVSYGFGKEFGITRQWNPRNSDVTGEGWTFVGLPHVEEVKDRVDTTRTVRLVVVGGPSEQQWFTVGANDTPVTVESYAPLGSKEPPPTLTTKTGGDFLWRSGSKGFILFYGSGTGNTAGKFQSATDENGVTTAASYNADGNYSEVTRTLSVGGVTTKESYVFTYIASGLTNAGRLRSVLLRRKSWSGSEPAWSSSDNIRQVEYGYYNSASGIGGNLRTASVVVPSAAQSISIAHTTTTATVTLSAHGYAVGDLVTISGATQEAYNGTFTITGVTTNTFTYTMEDDPGASASGSPTVNKPIDINYYRYKTSGGTAGLLTMVFGPQAYGRLDAAFTDPLSSSVTDNDASPYADYVFDYDSTGRVSSETPWDSGGQAYTFSYTKNTRSDPNPGSVDYNVWRARTTEILPDDTPGDNTDNGRNIVYTNEIGEVMLKIFQQGASGPMWGTFYKFNSSGQVTMVAHPSALNLPSLATLEANDDLLDAVSGNYAYMRDNTGKIDIYEFYSSTTATNSTPGGVSGSLYRTYLQHGELGVETGKQLASGALTRLGSTATVSLTGHGYSTGDQILITGANQSEYNGVFTLLTAPTNSFTFTVSGTPASPATGTIVVYRIGNKIRLTQRDYFDHDNGGSGTNSAHVYPLADYIEYANTDATGARTTSFTYTWTSSSLHMESQIETDPAVTYTQNGPGTNGVSITTFFNAFGDPTWFKDGDSYLRYEQWDVGTGALLKEIVDVDASKTSTFSNLPAGWSTPSGGGLHLTTTYEVDSLGRATKMSDPKYNAHTNVADSTFVVYNDAKHEVRTYPHFDGTNTTGPIQIVREDRAGSYIETLTLTNSPHLNGSNVPDGGETIVASNIASLDRQFFNVTGEMIEDDAYFDTSLLTYTTGTNLGTLGTNFYHTTYGYDGQGNLNKLVNPVGTITRTVRDGMERVTDIWMGTSDASWTPSNAASMTKVQSYLYDTYDPATTVSGDSNVTRVINYPTGTNSARITESFYDWRDRLIATKAGVLLDASNLDDPGSEASDVQRQITYSILDNLGEATQEDQYDGDGAVMVTGNAPTDIASLQIDGIPDAPDSSTLRSRQVMHYDDLGRVYQSDVVDVNQSTGAPVQSGTNTISLKTWNWFDKRGNRIKTLAPGGLATKYSYDGAGRVVKQFWTDAGGDALPASGTNNANWANSGDEVGDVVLEQLESQYDENGNVIFAIDRMRFHNANAPGTNSGDLSLSPASGSARSSYEAYYFDLANRLTDKLDVGTDGGSAYSRLDNVPSRSDTNLVTSFHYNSAGRQDQVTDPRGLVSTTTYDLLSRPTKTIANYVDGTPSAADDQTIEYTYDGANHVLTMKVDLPSSAFQTTQYIYGTTNTAGSDISSNDLLAKIKYPDKSSGNPSTNTADIESFTYNALGEQKTLADRNGNTHTYSYDVLGRLTVDNVTTLGSGVNGSVRRLEYTFDTAGRPYQMTSYSASNGGSVVNQVRDSEYNGYGQLITQYQSHSGSVNTSFTPKVQYAYSEGGVGITDNNSRLTEIIYPNGRILHYEYGTTTSLSNKISRLAFLADDAGGAASAHIEDYEYLGLDTPVIRNRPNGNSELTLVHNDTLIGDGGDQYTGLDRFGRTVDQNWIGQSGSNTTTLDRFKYGYDRDSNPLYKENEVDGTFSELYHSNGATNGLDGLNRLTSMSRGTLSDSNSDGVPDTVGTLNTLAGSGRTWTLDAVGNWTSNTSAAGTNSASTQTRTFDTQNEITGLSGLGATDTPTYDHAGNTNKDETGKLYAYDAWNRLVAADASCANGGALIESLYYDALGRRITEAPTGSDKELYYSDEGQVLEEQNVTCGVAATNSQYVWSPLYPDELIERDRDADTSADGTLDTSFSSDGKQSTNISGTDIAFGVVIQPDGKTLAIGSGSNRGVFAVARYNLDGSLDSSFGSSGTKTTSFPGTNTRQEAYAGAIQSDGKIVAGGFVDNGSTITFAIARYTADGTLDTSFSSDGMQTTNFWGNDDEIHSIVIQPDGKIVAAGFAYDSTSFLGNIAIARYNTDGSLDTSFGTGGKVTYQYNSAETRGVSVALDADGNILVAAADDSHFLLVRFTSSGSLDTTFGTSGVGKATFSSSAEAESMAVQADGKILISGSIGSTTVGLARFLSTGAIDTSFGSSGTQTASISGLVQAMRLQSDGKIVVGGYQSGDFEVARFTTAGVLDTSFDTDGMLTTNLGGVDQAYALAIGPDYKITVVGATGSDFGLARYKVASSLEERLYVETDAGHNVTSISDTFGAVKERFVYDPYGSATVLTSAWASTSDSYGWLYRNQGLRYDSTTNTLDNFGRIYMIGLGRFAQNDIGYPDGANRYQREVSNPITFIDPSGRLPVFGDLSRAGNLNRIEQLRNGGMNSHYSLADFELQLRVKLEDLERRKDQDALCDQSNAAWLWQEIQKVKAQLRDLLAVEMAEHNAGYDATRGMASYAATLGQGFLNALNSLTDFVYESDWSSDVLAPESDAAHRASKGFAKWGYIAILLALGAGPGAEGAEVAEGTEIAEGTEAGAEMEEAQAAEREACGTDIKCFLAGTLVLLGDGKTEEAIEDIHVGQRVATDGGVANSADGKTKAADPNATDVDPATWRLVNLEIDALTVDGGIDVMQVQELMPLALLEAEHAQPGGCIPVPLDLGDINEVGQGAIVQSIEPCPQIESGPGRVVLTTITHLNDYSFHLTLADALGRTETLGITGFHKMYTEDRGWIPAADLMIGEQIRGAHGDLRVANLTRDFGVHRVYNMTVEADHVYFVGELTAISHNIADCEPKPPGPPEYDPTRDYFGELDRLNQKLIDTFRAGNDTQDVIQEIEILENLIGRFAHHFN